MAKKSTATAFKGAVIDKDFMITEIGKDFEHTYDLKKIIDEWVGIEGISLTIRSDSEIAPMED